MKKMGIPYGGYLILICLLLVQGASAAELPGESGESTGSGATGPESGRVVMNMIANIPVFFVPNEGQADPEVLFTCRAQGYFISFASDRIGYLLPWNEGGAEGRYVMSQRYSGGNPDPVVEGIEPLETRVNYFYGTELEWDTDITPHAAIVYRELYPGIDVVYRGEKGGIKREFLVRPGADPHYIRMIYEGAGQVRMAGDGGLVVRAGSGEIRESVPVCYQEVDGGRVEIPCRFDVSDDGSVSFYIGGYDRSLPLIIDPKLLYCGYIGGADADRGYDIAVDAAGNAYVAGATYSPHASFPEVVGPSLSMLGDEEAFVAKVNPSGTALVYCGYIGEVTRDSATGIAVDAAGNAYITGTTQKTGGIIHFPTIIGPYLSHSGGFDAFVAKVNPTGNGLVYCGYLGGSGEDIGSDIAVDLAGSAYVTGYTTSTDTSFPRIVGPDLNFNSGIYDAFVAKVKADGSGLDYCGYIGGNDLDNGAGIAVDPLGYAYVTGTTRSSQATFPENVGPDLTHDGESDAFVAKVNATGDMLIYCGYFGGAGNDEGFDIAVDRSCTFPCFIPAAFIAGTYYNGVNSDAFMAKVDPWGTGILNVVTIPGNGFDVANGVDTDLWGNAYITGATNSTSLMVHIGPDLTHNGGFDAFVAKVNAAGSAIMYCGYLGGSGDEYGNGIAVDAVGNAYISGNTGSNEASFPVTVGPDTTYNGEYDDAFVAKVSPSRSSIAVFRPSTHTFYLDYNGNGVWNGAGIDRAYNFGLTGDTPVIGDWEVQRGSCIGVYRPSTHTFYLDYNGNGVWNGAGTDRAYTFGLTGDMPVSGAWTWQWGSSIGVYRPSTHTFYLDWNGNGVWNGAVTDRAYNFGLTGDTPVIGDWAGLGRACIGVFRPSTHTFYLDWNGNGVWDGTGTDRAINFGLTGDMPVSGDWAGLGRACIGVFRPSTHTFYLDWNGNGVWDGVVTDRAYNFGLNDDKAVAGVWG